MDLPCNGMRTLEEEWFGGGYQKLVQEFTFKIPFDIQVEMSGGQLDIQS